MSAAVSFPCPHCGTQATVSQVQGDRCPSCDYEFNWFGPGEERTAQDYLAALTGKKYLVPLPEQQSTIVAHE